ncbi:MAG TPA: SGNH/GDSL hydrolase family protein [Xanthobacteraceae bacterium]|nr:SGNH/GDSL hydrolase family protein [Xanthobacteraceae bacterium]
MSYPLPHVGRLIAAGLPVKIITLGSSSTAGAGASSPAASYPSRLAVELTNRFPKEKFVVLNRGTNGEEARRMVDRLESSLIAEKADLVIWQLGTNSVLRDRALEPVSSLVAKGAALLREAGADVILVDPQYAPKVIAKGHVGDMVDLLEVAAETAHVDLFRRFALMRYWHDARGMDFAAFLSPDQLHMNDWSYACLAKAISAAIVEAAKPPTASAAMQQAQHTAAP